MYLQKIILFLITTAAVVGNANPPIVQKGMSIEAASIIEEKKNLHVSTVRLEDKDKADKRTSNINSFNQYEKMQNKIFKNSGNEGGGGGDSAESNGRRRLLDLIERDDLEYFIPETVLKKSEGYYSTVSPTYVFMLYYARFAVQFQDYDCKQMPKFESRDAWGGNAFLLTVALSYLPGLYESNMNCPGDTFSKSLDYVYQNLKIERVTQLRWAFTEDDLQNLNDEGLIRIENPQTKRQLAVQIGTLVVINKKEFMLLDEESKQALFIHESVLRAVLVLSPDHVKKYGTQYIRAYVRNALKLFKNPEGVPSFIASDVYKLFEIKK